MSHVDIFLFFGGFTQIRRRFMFIFVSIARSLSHVVAQAP
jgi:hypothetical protein